MFSTYTLALFGVATLGAGMWGLGWLRRDSPAATPYLTFTTGMIVWTLAYAWEIEAQGYGAMVLAAKIQYLAIPVVPVAVFWFALLHTGRTALHRLPLILGSYTISAITVVLAWTNELHGLIWKAVRVAEGPDWSVLDVTYGSFFWVHTAASYGFMLAAMAVVIPTALQNRGIWQRQTALLVIGLALPWVANFLRLLGLSPVAPLDSTPFAFAIAAILFGFAGLNLQFLSITPLARELVIDTIADGLAVIDPRGRLIDLNRAGSGILGVRPSETVGLPAKEVLGPFAEALALGNRSVTIVPDSGRVFDCSSHPIGHDTGQGHAIVLLLRDVTRLTEAQRAAEKARDDLEVRVQERTEELVQANLRITEEMESRLAAQQQERRLEAQLRHTQKLDTIGTLVGGIAHDFNNLLAVILGYAELASRELTEAHPIRDDLDQAVAAAHRARTLVGQILTFSRRSEPERTEVCLRESVEEAVSLLKAVIPATIDLQVNLKPVPQVLADPTQMQQVLLNLCSNASQAMPQGGRLVISLSPSSPPLKRSQGAPTVGIDMRKWVVLRVEDSGHGMDKTTLDHVFEPFFTTKKVREGTGLGLSVVRGIVTGHGGEIAAESVPGTGTTFSIFLPVSEAAPSAIAAPSAPAAATRGTVLLVDDEGMLLRLWRRLLEGGGYRVVEHRRGTDALEALRSTPGDFALVLTDHRLPDMDGLGLSREAQQIRPGMPILLMSGNAPAVPEDEREVLGIRGILQKPLEGGQLLDAVAEALSITPVGSRLSPELVGADADGTARVSDP